MVRKRLAIATVPLAVGLALIAAVGEMFFSAAANDAFPSRTPSSTPGAQIFASHCAACHAHGANRAPALSILGMMSPTAIKRALTAGPMRLQAQDLSASEKREVAEYLSGRKVSAQNPGPPPCKGGRLQFEAAQRPELTAWGVQLENTRLIPSGTAGLDRKNVPHLHLKWAVGFPDAVFVRSQPAVAGGAIILGSNSGMVYALDRATGCQRWAFRADAEVRTGVVVSPGNAGDQHASRLAYFGDLTGNIYAVDAESGKLVWRDKSDSHPSVTITAAPALYRGRLYVPVSSLEELILNPKYACCTFRGSVVAYDARNGKRLWQTFMTDVPNKRGRNSAGAEMFGPSGAAIWNTPTIDRKRARLYIGTGDNYSSPATPLSDAVVALDLATGHVAWSFQANRDDAFNSACATGPSNICPKENGPDFDFGAAVILVKSGGRDLLLAGQKSSWIYAIDADSGKLVWKRKVGRGGMLGGIYFGMAAAGDTLFLPVSDLDDGRKHSEPPQPGLYAISIQSGRILWRAPAPTMSCNNRKLCAPGIAAAITATPDLVLTGGTDGWLRIYDTHSGAMLWTYDTEQAVPSVGGGVAKGGSMGGGAGPLAFDGMLIAESGYGFGARAPGNALLVFDTH